MLSKWFGKKAEWPEEIPTNPGRGVSLDIAFSNGERSWTEKVNLVDLLADTLQTTGRRISKEKARVTDLESGLVFMPGISDFQPLDEGGVQTCSTIQIHHRELFPDGVFEYQHSIGESTGDSLVKGFQGWLNLDFPPVLDCLGAELESEECMRMEMEFSDSDSKRRIVLGPVNYFAESQPPAPAQFIGEENEHHPGFCPCCLFTHTIDAFEPFLKESKEFHAIRFYAARDREGGPQADCRINGEDYDPGKEALIDYVNDWPDLGFEFRKQYIVIRSVPER